MHSLKHLAIISISECCMSLLVDDFMFITIDSAHYSVHVVNDLSSTVDCSSSGSVIQFCPNLTYEL